MSGLDGLGWPTPDNVERERDQQPASAGCHPTTCSPWSDAPETLHEWRKSETLRPDPRSKRMANHAVKLERERDEARETCSELVTDSDAITLARTVVRLTQDCDEARGRLAGIENKMRGELGGHPDSELWGDAGLIAATMRCVDAIDMIEDLVTTDHETKEAFIQRVRGILGHST